MLGKKNLKEEKNSQRSRKFGEERRIFLMNRCGRKFKFSVLKKFPLFSSCALSEKEGKEIDFPDLIYRQKINKIKVSNFIVT